MSMVKGTAACNSGLSGRIYTAWVTTMAATNGFSGTLSAAQDDAVKALCFAIASAVYDEITTNGVADPGFNNYPIA